MHLVPVKAKKTPSSNHQDHDKHAGHSPNVFKKKFWLSLVLTVPVLLFSTTVQSWIGLNFSFAGSEFIPAIFGIILFWYGGLVFLKSAKIEIAGHQPGMMTLISMAITVAFLYSLAITLRLVSGMDFWWELATLITIMLLGHWLEMASVKRAQGALNELAKLLPDEAELITGNSTKKIAVAELKVGDIVLVRPGAKVPADGEVIKGTSSVNESMLTGESKAVHKAPNSQVIAGTINGMSALTIRINKVGDDTALAGIMKLVADAQSTKSKTQILADSAASYLTFIALGAAIVTWLGWGLFTDASFGFILARIVTVLIIACPHALGLAVPLVTSISTTIASKNGLLVKQRLALEAARNVDVILFDKTGTLTKGEQGVIDVITNEDPSVLIGLAAAVENESEHPIARAIVTSAKQKGIAIARSKKSSALAGRGAQATIGDSVVYVGGPSLLKELRLSVPRSIVQSAEQASKNGSTVVYVIKDSTVLGAIVLADVIREESREAVAILHGMGKRVAMLTGDAEGVAAWVAKELGIKEYFAEILPENKAAIVKKLQADGSRVAMVGDGVNDAPALTQAEVGIAIGAGTDVAIESAGIVLIGSDPRGVAKTITLSKVTYRKMMQNLAWATGYNVIAIPLAAGVTFSLGFVLSPAVGAILMSLSTIIVAANAQLLHRVKL
jgi:Cu2+-exporting ATPase